MSVVVKGMRIPESCTKCKFAYKEESYEPKEGMFYSIGTCKDEIIKSNYYTMENKKYAYSRPDYCPLIEIPEKHGRLIDADKLMDDIKKNSASYFADDFAREWVDVQPTVIEAEDES